MFCLVSLRCNQTKIEPVVIARPMNIARRVAASFSAFCLKLIEADVRIYASVDLRVIGSDNGLLPIRYQANIWTNDDMLSIVPQGTHFNEILF